MNRSLSRTARGGVSGSDLLMLFLFFLSGACCSRFGLLPMTASFQPRLLLGLLMGALLFFSASSFGWFFLPLCLFFCGGLLEELVSRSVFALLAGNPPDFSVFSCSFLLVPLYFLTGLHGLKVSDSLERALRCASPSVADDYRMSLSKAAIFSLIGFAVIFCFT